MSDAKRGLRAKYNANLSLLTDLYQVTMAYAGWKSGFAEKGQEKITVFELYYRSNPFGGGFAVSCGLSSILDLIEDFHISQEDCEYLASLTGADQEPLFEKAFLDYLRDMKLTVDVEAIEEGRVVFANQPILRIKGPILQCQLLETPLLNLFNFETLIATKASRVKEAAGKDQVLEFGLRRAQGIDGALLASRAAYVGGADASSNVLAGKIYGIPQRGTHAHSWVMAFDDEQEAFNAFAKAMPNNSVLLVDTYDTLEGVRKAVETAKWLKSQGHSLLGIRLDSGDLAYLSFEARKILDRAGLNDTKIVASNDLDENLIVNLKLQGAKIDIWGVGTKLVTAYDQPALGGVYKLTAVKDGQGPWQYRIKLSEQMIKVTTPGIHQVRRFMMDGLFAGDMIFDIDRPPKGAGTIVDPFDHTRRKSFGPAASFEDLLKPCVRNGKVIAGRDSLDKIRERRLRDVEALHPAVRRFLNPHVYPVGLEPQLYSMKNKMILDRRGLAQEEIA